MQTNVNNTILNYFQKFYVFKGLQNQLQVASSATQNKQGVSDALEFLSCVLLTVQRRKTETNKTGALLPTHRQTVNQRDQLER